MHLCSYFTMPALWAILTCIPCCRAPMIIAEVRNFRGSGLLHPHLLLPLYASGHLLCWRLLCGWCRYGSVLRIEGPFAGAIQLGAENELAHAVLPLCTNCTGAKGCWTKLNLALPFGTKRLVQILWHSITNMS